MAIIYLDPIYGNDAFGDGLSFLTAYKTLDKCHTVATDGDEIRVIKSNMPTQMAVNGTWTQDGQYITLSSEVTKSVNQVASNWTKNPAYTTYCSADSVVRAGDSRRYLDFIYLSSSPPSGAAKWAYQATDFSSYTGFEQISLLVRIQVPGTFLTGPLSGTPIADQFEIKLCSDTLGNTPVFTIPFPTGSVATGIFTNWHPLVFNIGSNIGAIQSIAIYSKSGFYVGSPGENCRIHIMNVVAATSPSTDNCITHLSLIGKNLTADRRFYPVRFIDGVNISIGSGSKTGSSNYQDSLTFANATFQGYPGTSQVTPPYILDPSRGGDFLIDESPSLASRTFTKGLTITGGWDDDVTQNPNGYSWFLPLNIYAAAAFDNHSQLFLISNSATAGRVFSLQRIGLGHFIYGINTQSSGISHTLRFNNVQICSVVSMITSSSYSPTINIQNSNIGGGQTLLALNTSLTSGLCSPILLRNCSLYNVTNAFIQAANCVYLEATSCQFINTLSFGMTIPESKFKGYNLTYYIKPGTIAQPLFINTTAAQQTKEVLIDGFSTNVGWTPYRFPSSFPIRIMRYQNNSNDHRIFYGKRNSSPFELSSVSSPGTIFSEFGSDRNTPTGLAWKMSPLDSVYITEENPLELPVVKIYVSNLNPITVSVWAKRDNTGIKGRLVLPTSQHGAPTSDVYNDYAAPAGSYSQISINFTPTVVGVVLEVYFRVWGGATFNFWVDDVTVT